MHSRLQLFLHPGVNRLLYMKILFVNHTFPPESYAGSELCVLYLAKELKQRGHEPHVFYRYSNPDDDELLVKHDEVEGIPTSKINHTFRFTHSFQNIYLYPELTAKFGYVLRTIKPDIVHLHHLTNLSLSIVKEIKDYGCPVVMTLHDYWLHCQRGQLLKPDMSLCDGPSFTKCRSCLSVQLLRGNAQRVASRLWKTTSPSSANSSIIRLLDVKEYCIQTAHPDFVANTHFDFDGKASPTLQAHPPSAITYNLELTHPALLKTAVAMHPSTYQQEGGGVRFTITVNGGAAFSTTINAKQNHEQRRWHPVEVQIHPNDDGACEIVLQTESELENDNQHCTAGWRDPVIIQQGKIAFLPSKSNWKKNLYPLAHWAAGMIAAWSPQANEGIEHRRNWTQRVLDEVDLFISPSHFLRNFFIRHGLPEDKILFLDNGFLLPDIKKTESPQKPIRFGYIGTWIPPKGVDIALKAFQGIDPNQARFIVHGFFPGYDGFEHYEDELKALAGPAVEFRGKYNPQDVYQLLEEIDCLIMPSIWWENSPMTIHEAFAAGVPVITADVGGMAEQVRHGGGATFKHRDPQSLRAVLDEIISNPGMLSLMQKTIPAVNSIESFADSILGIYQQLLINYE